MVTEVRKCPVCEGRGQVQAGFYMTTTGCFSSTSLTTEPCRSCEGRGWIAFVAVIEEDEDGK
jgi:DnaJ-class molecular chaperone